MGLDIYFYKRKKIENEPSREELKKCLEDTLFLIKNRKLFKSNYFDEYITETNEKFGLNFKCGYLRKHNYVYAYFSDRLVDQECEVTKDDLKDLIKRCKKVLAERNTETSKEELPTVSGFFFGSTDYDDFYYELIEEGLAEFCKMLAELKEDETMSVFFSY